MAKKFCTSTEVSIDDGSPLQFGSPDNRSEAVLTMFEKKYGIDDSYGATIVLGVHIVADSCADT